MISWARTLRAAGMHNAQRGRASRALIIFDDYMNTIDGDPTTEKLMPLIEEAGSSDIDVFCYQIIQAGIQVKRAV